MLLIKYKSTHPASKFQYRIRSKTVWPRAVSWGLCPHSPPRLFGRSFKLAPSPLSVCAHILCALRAVPPLWVGPSAAFGRFAPSAAAQCAPGSRGDSAPRSATRSLSAAAGPFGASLLRCFLPGGRSRALSGSRQHGSAPLLGAPLA